MHKEKQTSKRRESIKRLCFNSIFLLCRVSLISPLPLFRDSIYLVSYKMFMGSDSQAPCGYMCKCFARVYEWGY